MTELFDLDYLGPRAYIVLALAVIAGYVLYQWTRHLVFVVFATIVLVIGAGFWQGVLTVERTQRAWHVLKGDAEASLDAASDKAKSLGEMGHSTSAGSGSQTNEAYQKNFRK
ncbi:MAG: hypothetical protein EXR79_01830 [Myxococcales bacterium]|nr:hypothetical protein [Myxococcales bacterium]